MVSDLNSRSDLWADPSITRNAVGKYRCDRLIPPLRSSGSDLYGRDRQYKNTQFIKTAYRVAGRYSLSRLWFLRIGGDRSPYPKDFRPSGRRDRFRRKRGFSDHGVADHHHGSGRCHANYTTSHERGQLGIGSHAMANHL